MNILLKRIAKRDTYTIGKLYIDGVYVCDTLEDKDRGLTQTTPLTEIKQKKIYSETAIPSGTYNVTLKVKSPKYSKKQYFVNYCNAYMPRLLDVPGFDGILIHTGNTDKDCGGCILVGRNTIVGRLTDSIKTFEKIYPMLKEAQDKGEEIKITIE